jgi:hypothetical protein
MTPGAIEKLREALKDARNAVNAIPNIAERRKVYPDAFAILSAAVREFLATPPVPCVECERRDWKEFANACGECGSTHQAPPLCQLCAAKLVVAARKEALEEAGAKRLAAYVLPYLARLEEAWPECGARHGGEDCICADEAEALEMLAVARALSGSEDKNTTQEGA